MSAETVLENVLVEIGLDLPGVQIASDLFAMKQIRSFMDATGDDVSRRTEWSRLYEDLTVPGAVASVALPDNFQQLAERGAVRINKAGFHPSRGVVAPETWAFLTARPSAQPHHHLQGGQLHFSPALPAEGALVRFVSSQWVVGRDKIEQNADTFLIPERLLEKGTIWRWKRQKGLPYDDILAEYEADLIAEIKADRGEA